MLLVLTVSNGLHFLVAWEVFAVCGYFLITLDGNKRAVRTAGWLYLATSHAGTLCLCVFFGLLAVKTGGWELGPLRGDASLAPLLHFNGTPRAFEATWKYLLVGGTGIALSLLGSLCLGYASLYGGGDGQLTFMALMAQGGGLSRPWVLIAWVFLLVGYGTKMGLAPMHTCKPDAYGEAPVMVGAMLAGGVTSVAFTAIFVTGIFAVTACPPFGPFFSELKVLRAALETGHWAITAMFLGCLLLAFFGLSRVAFGIVDGRPHPAAKAGGTRFVETAGVIVPPLVLLALSLWLGLFTPRMVTEAWAAAVTQLYPN